MSRGCAAGHVNLVFAEVTQNLDALDGVNLAMKIADDSLGLLS